MTVAEALFRPFQSDNLSLPNRKRGLRAALPVWP